MKADRIDQSRFSVVAVSDDVLAKEARGLTPMTTIVPLCKGYLRATMLASSLWKASLHLVLSVMTLPGYQDEDADKINLWNRLSKLSETAEQGDARYRHFFLSQLPVDANSLGEESPIQGDGKQRHPANLAVNPHGKEPVMVCRNSLGTRGNEEVLLRKLTVIDSWLGRRFL